MTDRTDEIRARLAAATQGEWSIGRGALFGVTGLSKKHADLIAHAPDDLRHLLTELDYADRLIELQSEELDRVRQGLWDVYRILGFDTDGNDTPASKGDRLVGLVVEAAQEARADWDQACAEADLLDRVRAAAGDALAAAARDVHDAYCDSLSHDSGIHPRFYAALAEWAALTEPVTPPVTPPSETPAQ
jgi:hypothetical protein